MFDNIILIIKGIIIGMGKIIPGVSGSVLAITLNVYEPAIACISNLFSSFKKNVTYLGFLGIGIIISIVLGSKLLIYLLNNHYFSTFSLIIGLIIGTIPCILKEIKIKRKSDLLYILIPFLLIYFLSNLRTIITLNDSVIIYFIIGFVEAFTTVIPGISSTALYIAFDVYKLFLNLFSNILSMKFIFFSIGLFIGIFLTSKLVNYLFRFHKRRTYLVIISLLISSIVVLLKNILMIDEFSFLRFFFFLIVGFVISKLLDK